MPDDPYLIPRRPADIVHSVAQRAGITPDIADDYLALTQIESGHNVNVRNSSKGARGFGQVMPDVKGGTIRTVGNRKYDLTSPAENIEAGLRYFQEGGSDPVARRLHYFGGPRARQTYERTGRIPNISDGNMTAEQYVRATGGYRQAQQDPYLVAKPSQPAPSTQTVAPVDDPYLVAKSSGQTLPPQTSPEQRQQPPSTPVTPTLATPVPSITDALDQLTASTNRATQRLEHQAARPPVSRPINPLFQQFGQQRTIEQGQRQQEDAVRQQVTEERKRRQQGQYWRTGEGMLQLLAHPVQSVMERFTPEEENIQRETGERLRQQRVAESPEAVEIRKDYGRMSGGKRALLAPMDRFAAGVLSNVGGVASGFGIRPNDLSKWANARAEVLNVASSASPLAESRNLSSLVTGDTQLEEVRRGIPEEALTGVADLGLTIAQIALLQKASGISLPKLLALEGAAKASDKPVAEQVAAAGEGYALGRALNSHLGRAGSAALFGVPTALQTGYEVSQGRMSPVDAAIQTGVQAGAGFALGGGRQRDPQTEVQSPVGSVPPLASEAKSPAEATPIPLDQSRSAEMLGAGPAELSLPQRFYHRDFGEVSESPNQRRVGKGRVRVVAEDGSEHVIKRASLTGAGNQRAVPIREPAPEPPLDQYLKPQGQPTVEPAQSPATESPSPLRQKGESTTRVRPPGEVAREPLSVDEPTVTEPVTEPRSTAPKNAAMSADRAELGLPELERVKGASAEQVLADAKQANVADPRRPDILVEQALRGGRNFTDTETMQVNLRAVEIKSRVAELQREIAEAKDDATIADKGAEIDTLINEFDRLSQAQRKSGTEWGRAGIARQRAIDEDYSLVSMVAKFRKDARRVETPVERAQIEQLYARNAELETKLAEAESRRADRRLQDDIDRTARRQQRTRTTKTLNDEFAQLQTQFAQARAETRDIQPSGLAGLDPEGKLTALIAKMARNRIEAGVNKAEALVDEVYEAVKAHLPASISKRDVRDAISGYSIGPKTTRSEIQKQIDALKSELHALSKGEDVESGVRSTHREGPKEFEVRRLPMEGPRKSEERSSGIPRQGPRRSDVRKLPSEGPKITDAPRVGPRLSDIRRVPEPGPKLSDANKLKAEGPQMVQHGPPKAPFSRDLARQRAIEKELADLDRRMSTGDFSDKSPRQPPRYTRETAALQRQLEQNRAKYARLRYRATRSTGGKITDELAKAANVPKTIKSIGDVSAMFRQGGYYAITHPIAGLAKPTQAMLRSITDTGWRNVEAMIKDDPAFEKLKQAGVEFTGVDKADPNLSHREEGYLGGEYLDYIPVAKQVKDFSERTFVSFLDAQRLHVGKTILDGMTEAQRANPAEVKAVARLINIATGRGELGKRGNQLAPALNIAMFSPRLLASRVQLLNNMINPVTIARMPAGARKAMIADNVKFLAATGALLGLAKAAGATVSTDPDDAEFLKIRVGNTVYDTLTGLQQPLRYIANMARAASPVDSRPLQAGPSMYSGRNMAEMSKQFARSKLNPALAPAIDFISGQDFEGRKFSAGREARDLAIPLPLKDVYEGLKEGGLIFEGAKPRFTKGVGSAVAGGLQATPTFVGVGVGSYPPAPDKPRTHAEKLARKLLREGMPPSEAREEEQIDTDREKAQLRARSRAGESVNTELVKLIREGKITDRQAKRVVQAKGRTRLSEDLKTLDPDESLRVYSVMNADERRVSAASIRQKIANSKADAEKKRRFRERARELGLVQ